MAVLQGGSYFSSVPYLYLDCFYRLLSSVHCGVHKPQRRPLCVSGNAGLHRASFIIFLSSAGNCPLGDSGDSGDSDIGIPPRMSRHRHPDILLSEAARRRIAGRQPCFKGVQRERLAHGSLQGKV